MPIHKRGVRRLDLVDHSAVPPVLALRMSYEDRRDETRERQTALQVWETEGGNPVLFGVVLQSVGQAHR